MNAPVVSLPSGLIGDEGPEEAIDAARRELAEETGHTAEHWQMLDARSRLGRTELRDDHVLPGAAGRARRARRRPHDVGKIRVHIVPVAGLRDWARRRETEGAVIDPKIWAGLYLALGR